MPQAQYQFLLDLANTKFENDMIARGLAAQDQPSTYDITDRVMEASVRRGRDNELDPFGPGSMTLLLDNTDWRFTPDYGASPLYGKLRPGAMVTARVPVPDYTGLVSWWTLDEAGASTRYDSYGTNHLSVSTAGTVTQVAGLVGNGARVGNLDYLKVASNATLQAGDTDFSVTCWVKLESGFTSGYIASKFNDAAGGNEWALWYGSSLFKFTVYTTGGAATTITASTFGAPSADTWYFVSAFHDSVNNVIGISVNNGAIDTSTYSAGVCAGSAALVVGAYDSAAVSTDRFTVDNLSFWRRVLPTVTPSSLLTSLVSYWKLDEASGTRYDSVTTSANDLTDNNTVTQAAGKISNAGQFTRANSEYLNHTDNASLSTGDIDFTIAAWLYIDSFTGYQTAIAKRTEAANREYGIDYSTADSRFRFYVTPNGSTFTTVKADNLGAPSLATWYFVVVWHDSALNTINIQVNNGTVNSTAHATGVYDGASDFFIGRVNNADYWDGRVDEVGFWKRVLTATERTNLYNSGNGVTYPFTGIP